MDKKGYKYLCFLEVFLIQDSAIVESLQQQNKFTKMIGIKLWFLIDLANTK